MTNSIPKPLQVAFNKIFVEKTMEEAFSQDSVEAVSELTEKYPELKNRLFREMIDSFYAGRHPEKTKKPEQASLFDVAPFEKPDTRNTGSTKKDAEALWDKYYESKEQFKGKDLPMTASHFQAVRKYLKRAGFPLKKIGSNKHTKWSF